MKSTGYSTITDGTLVVKGKHETVKWQFPVKGGKTVKTVFKKFEKTMAAAAYAEAGEFETARQIMREDRARKSEQPSIHPRPSARKEMRAD